jgi:hypothetical protein
LKIIVFPSLPFLPKNCSWRKGKATFPNTLICYTKIEATFCLDSFPVLKTQQEVRKSRKPPHRMSGLRKPSWRAGESVSGRRQRSYFGGRRTTWRKVTSYVIDHFITDTLALRLIYNIMNFIGRPIRYSSLGSSTPSQNPRIRSVFPKPLLAYQKAPYGLLPSLSPA